MAIINGDRFNNSLVGGIDNDTINGFDGNDTLDGAGSTFNNNEIDVLNGGFGADLFILGDSVDAYYRDDSFLGESSYARIVDFFPIEEGDRIEVFGNRSDYKLENNFQGGVDIIYNGDLIGVVEGTTNVSLDRDFIFVTPTPPTPTIDPAQYLASYGDLIQAFSNLPYDQALIEAENHYNNTGINEGRFPDLFAEDQYLASHLDLIQAFGNQPYQQALDNATQQYIEFGFFEARALDTFFEDIYLASNGDLINEFINVQGQTFEQALDSSTAHYIEFGANEQRPLDTFNPTTYLNNNADLQAVFGNDLFGATQHYIEFGYFEGRVAV